ncbi:hypothetical protein NGH63_02215 [Staphylococcus xylosus]|uniref:hypothetical protein n=1 Tax=Staphylococcus xylosus TaxID=1288 RepID=UPI002DB9432A|nr:hypothetical protein [Staphylococcus xylosus]MEB8175277.1 hypothetical protein [Staphylococcus xylosus]
MRQTEIKDMMDNQIKIQGQQSTDPVHRKGDKKPIIAAKGPQHIKNSQIQYLD